MSKIRLRVLFDTVNGAMSSKTKAMSSKDIRLLTAQLDERIAAVRSGKLDKKYLPGVCWAARFNDGMRHAESAEPNGLAYMDIDHIGQFYKAPEGAENVALVYYLDKMYGREEDFGIVHAQISPSGDGLHIVFIPENGGSIEEAQRAFAAKVGIEQYDYHCHDISRLLFLSSLRDTLFDAIDQLYDD